MSTISFYELFEKAVQNTCTGTQALRTMFAHYPNNRQENAKKIKDIEHEGDQITHQTVEKLNKTFLTPLDREDIYELITRLDDVIDLIDGAASRIILYKIEYIPQEAREFSEVLVKACEILAQGINNLPKLKKSQEILQYCIKIHTLENEGDNLLRKAMVQLFEGKKDDPIYVIKWKEIYEDLEAATDRCEDVANIIEGIILKYA